MSEPIFESVAWIYKMAITLIVAAVAIGIVGYAVKQDTNVRDVQAEIMVQRFLYSPDGIWYKENGQVIPGVIDASLLDQAQVILDQGFSYPKPDAGPYGGMRITLTPLEFNGIATTYPTPLYVNQKIWETLSEQVYAGQKGTGQYSTHVYPVIIRSKTSGTSIDKKYLLRIEVVVPQRA